MYLRIFITFLLLSSALPGQHRVDPRNSHERMLCVVPMVGAGTYADPRRPAYAPVQTPGTAPSRSGIIGYSFQVSDDGQYALVEFVALNRAAFQALLADQRPGVKVFEKGKARKEDVLTEFKRLKKDFKESDLDQMGVRLP